MEGEGSIDRWSWLIGKHCVGWPMEDILGSRLGCLS